MTAIRRIDGRVVYENAWLTVTEDVIQYADGTSGIYGVVHKPDFAVVIPIEGDRVHLVEQYRYPVGGRYWEFPQGALRDGQPHAPEEIAEVELAEETGLRATELTVLGFLHDAYGVLDNGYHVVVATGLTQGAAQRESTEQDMRSQWFGLDEVWEMIADGRMTDSTSVAALALLMRYREQNA